MPGFQMRQSIEIILFLKQTRFYQEVFAEGKQEGKLEAVSRRQESGVDLETIAQWLDLPLELVIRAFRVNVNPYDRALTSEVCQLQL